MSGVPIPALPAPARRTRAGLRSADPAAVLEVLTDARRLAAAGLMELARVLERGRAGAGDVGQAGDRRRVHALVVLAAVRVLLVRLTAALPGYVEDARRLGVAEEVLAAVAPSPACGPGALIERSPVRVRAPHHVPDERFTDLLRTDTVAWRAARRLDRQEALREPLAGLPLSEYERRIVEHLAAADTGEVAVIVALLHRARAAVPVVDPAVYCAGGGAR